MRPETDLIMLLEEVVLQSKGKAHIGAIIEPENHARSAPDSRVTAPWLTSRIAGPGAIYNAGNLLALFGGMAVYWQQAPDQSSIQSAIYQYLMGSPDAAWLSLSMMIFLVSGEIYHRAYRSMSEVSETVLQWADFISGLAAIALTIALVHLGDIVLALAAGGLLAGGKLGSAVLPMFGRVHTARIASWLRWAVVASRLPSILSLLMTIYLVLQTNQPWEAAALPAIMTISFLLWLLADLCLMRR